MSGDAVAWRQDAACAQLDPREADALFFSSGAYGERAYTICDNCPVLDQCRDEGDQFEAGVLSRYHVHGFRAGESASERLARRARTP